MCDAQFPQFHLYFVRAAQLLPESELGRGEGDAGLLHCALQIVLVQRQKKIAGVDGVTDFDRDIFDEAIDLCDYLEFFDEV